MRTTLAALLHDIGKFYQRTGISLEKQYYRYTKNNGYYHAGYTAKFIEEYIKLAFDQPFNLINESASHHIDSEGIVKISDIISSGHDRKDASRKDYFSEDTEKQAETNGNYKVKRMNSIFDEIKTEEHQVNNQSFIELNTYDKYKISNKLETTNVAKSEEEEANWIANKIEDIVNNQDGVNYRDIAILYRANYLSRTIEQVLIRKGIDYRIFGGLKFFNRKEVKDALSYLRLVCNQEDLAFERIINTPARGIGKKTLENIQLVALNHQISLYDALTLHSDEIRLSNKSKKEVRILVEAIEKARRSTLPLHEMFENLMIDVGYIEMLKNDLEDNRIDNIHELQRSIYDFQVSHEDAPTLENYLQDISLYTDNDAIDQGQYVSLMSIHMAKGLEFDYVFVLGLSEGIFPSFRSLAEDGDDGLEEERRLAYVAFTRARKQLFLTDSEGFSFVTDSPKISSRFIDEVGNEGIIHSGSKPRFKTTDYVPKQTVSKAELIGDNKVDDWKVGDLVNHDIFGKGVVVKVNKNILDIAFELPAGLKSLMANHKALKKLTN